MSTEEVDIDTPQPYKTTYEIYIGNLSPDITEEDIDTLFASVIKPIDVRIKKNNDGMSRGYGFVTFNNKEEAYTIIEKFNKSLIKEKPIELKNGKSNSILFLGGIRRNWKQEKITELVKNTLANVYKVIYINDASDMNQNRGYCFIRFDDRESAIRALNRITRDDFLLGGQRVKANWADTQSDFESTDGVNKKALYVYPIVENIDEHILNDIFKEYGEIEVVLARKLPRSVRHDFAFINFRYEEDALKAVEDSKTNKKKFLNLNVEFARKSDKTAKNNRRYINQMYMPAPSLQPPNISTEQQQQLSSSQVINNADTPPTPPPTTTTSEESSSSTETSNNEYQQQQQQPSTPQQQSSSPISSSNTAEPPPSTLPLPPPSLPYAYPANIMPNTIPPPGTVPVGYYYGPPPPVPPPFYSYPINPMNSYAYKTKLCRHFMNGNECSHGDACTYAHGERELRRYPFRNYSIPQPM